MAEISGICASHFIRSFHFFNRLLSTRHQRSWSSVASLLIQSEAKLVEELGRGRRGQLVASVLNRTSYCTSTLQPKWPKLVGLVLGCIGTDLRKYIVLGVNTKFSAFSRSVRVSHLCTPPNWKSQQNFGTFVLLCKISNFWKIATFWSFHRNLQWFWWNLLGIAQNF